MSLQFDILQTEQKETQESAIVLTYFLEVVNVKLKERHITIHPDEASALYQLRKHGRFGQRPNAGGGDREEKIFDALQGPIVAVLAKIAATKVEPIIAIASAIPSGLVTP